MPADPSMKIMVVDDMSTMRRIVKNLLKQLGFANVAEAQKENIIEAVQAGVSNYVVKPFTAEILQEKMAKIFK
jgi:two-component system, chemotaxis family, chemotaxis protein CheY